MAKNYLQNTLTTLAGIYAINSLIDIHARNLAERQKVTGHKYNWKHGEIFYKKKGVGSPLLLIHNLGHRSASYEWDDIIHFLAKKYTVYSVDLPGCGRSDKPKYVYTAYFYIQFIKDFINEVIKEKPDVVASRDSSEFIIMANSMENSLFNKIILINPHIYTKKEQETNSLKLSYMKLLNLPIVGTAIYNAENFSTNVFRPTPLGYKFSENSLTHTINAYVSSHLKNSNGKFLRASNINNFTKVYCIKQLAEADNINILISNTNKDLSDNLKNLSIDKITEKISELSVSGEFPHMSHPGNLYSAIKNIL